MIYRFLLDELQFTPTVLNNLALFFKQLFPDKKAHRQSRLHGA